MSPLPRTSARVHGSLKARLGSATIAAVLAIATLVCVAQPGRAEWDVDGIEELLPHHETAAERQQWLEQQAEMPTPTRLADPPPVAPVRNCAEWEPATGVLIRYPLGLPYTLLRDFDDDATLHVIVSSSLLATATSNLTANGVDMAQVQFLVEPNNSIWTRDYGPWFVFDGQEDIAIIDHVYNRPARPDDNRIPLALANQLGLPAISHDMWHTGGNYMTDGANISSSTRLVYNEAAAANGMTEAQVDQLMSDYYGVGSYEVLDYIEAGGIHHIDTWAKFLDEETVLVKEVWPAHGTYDDLEQRATLFASLQASTGRNYRVFRVYCHNIGGNRPASYTNSLMLNDGIYVPTFASATNDAAALAVYEAAMPGYTVRGYDYGGWLTDDALHCRAKGVMDRDMLRVAHLPVFDAQSGAVPVTATVIDHSDAGISSVELSYRFGAGAWTSVPMTSGVGDEFAGVIPEPVAAGTTDYYIQAASTSGRTAGMPRVAPAHWYTFDHAPATTAVDDAGGGAGAPPSTLVHGSSPNPFRSHTSFEFELHHAAPVELVIFDVQGRAIRKLVAGERPAGLTRVDWDGRDSDGRRVVAGVYYFRLEAAGLRYSRPVTIVD